MADKREKIHFASVEELLGAPTETGEGTVELKLSEIYGFENHPFKVIDDDKMEDLVQRMIRHQEVNVLNIYRQKVKWIMTHSHSK